MQPGFGMMTRRQWLQGSGALVATAAAGCSRPSPERATRGRAAVAILRAESYRVDLVDRLVRGAAACGLKAKGKRVLLKPNLVEFARGAVIHTQVEVLA